MAAGVLLRLRGWSSGEALGRAGDVDGGTERLPAERASRAAMVRVPSTARSTQRAARAEEYREPGRKAVSIRCCTTARPEIVEDHGVKKICVVRGTLANRNPVFRGHARNVCVNHQRPTGRPLSIPRPGETTVAPEENFCGIGIILKIFFMTNRSYRGRFAPSPTGPLHTGSLVAALASWLDARAHNGKWLIRIEDIDPPRERPGAAAAQVAQLAQLGMIPDEPILLQSGRGPAYAAALQMLDDAGRTFRCNCSRGQRAAPPATNAPADAYPGTCRSRQVAPPAAVRFRVPGGTVVFEDRACGPFAQDVEQVVGDPVILRADGYWAYQLAVVVDDAFQEITDVVRGADLLDNTPRQIFLQQALGLPRPRYLHHALVRDAHGRKLSKRDGDAAPQVGGTGDAVALLEQAWAHLGFPPTGAGRLEQFQQRAIDAWQRRFVTADAAAPSR
jgi:glutamyl-Q tRNA(Asp) synthetase